jgi:hypothetical protein
MACPAPGAELNRAHLEGAACMFAIAIHIEAGRDAPALEGGLPANRRGVRGR